MGAALKDCNCGTLNLKRFFVAVETLAHLRMGFFLREFIVHSL
ncbi:hypothetical protein C7434_4233 [Pantoea sp. PNA 14-12]|nr:hypothetical protein C7433_11116 [Pantoea sp. PNA 03-3]TDS66009.1 hypothetical protein C7434_4233 [Pantoea sp. PNA 14-12]WHS98801.1 MAG: hypothetical protein LZT29_01756 [Pantoea stewartii]